MVPSKVVRRPRKSAHRTAEKAAAAPNSADETVEDSSMEVDPPEASFEAAANGQPSFTSSSQDLATTSSAPTSFNTANAAVTPADPALSTAEVESDSEQVDDATFLANGLALMTVGARRCGADDAFKDFEKSMDYSVENMVNIGLVPGCTPKMSAFVLGSGIKAVDKRVEEDVDYLRERVANQQEALNDQAAIVRKQDQAIVKMQNQLKKQGELIQRLIDGNGNLGNSPEMMAEVSGFSNVTVKEKVFEAAIEKLDSRFTSIEELVNQAVLSGGNAQVDGPQLAARVKQIHDRERRGLINHIRTLVEGCVEEHERLEESFKQQIAEANTRMASFRNAHQTLRMHFIAWIQGGIEPEDMIERLRALSIV
ncbi:hypothetical protein B0T21DRAFT_417195 [Apiosordaria backusii]|uniref:Uncharacterized protein n=1 Tax=Apiosordaria backusii TaxID=314023 RepID=A0AA39ZPM3_9PEZI|nr:hypothetical protein B0T21DRAFT_417195 [Apiosordaria backusii]